MVYRVTICIHGYDNIYTFSNFHQAYLFCETEYEKLINKYSKKYTVNTIKHIVYDTMFDMVYLNDETFIFQWETITQEHPWPESFGHIERI